MSDAAALALDDIALLCGCVEWQYPGQVVRDVQALKARAETAERERDAATEMGRIMCKHERDRSDRSEEQLRQRDAQLAIAATRHLEQQERAKKAERDYVAVCEALDAVDHAEGHGPHCADVDTVCEAIRDITRRVSDYDESRALRERDSWDEDDGNVLWWRVPVNEPPYCGTPLDDDFPDYVTHWTPLLIPFGAEGTEHDE